METKEGRKEEGHDAFFVLWELRPILKKDKEIGEVLEVTVSWQWTGGKESGSLF